MFERIGHGWMLSTTLLTKRLVWTTAHPVCSRMTAPMTTAHVFQIPQIGMIKSYSKRLIMRTTQQMSITLPNEMADAIRTKVRAGEYATESEVIREGLRALLNRDRAIESWLQTQVVEAYDAIKSDPSRAVTIDQVRARLAKEHAKAK